MKKNWIKACPFKPISAGREKIRPKLVSSPDLKLALQTIGMRDGRFEPHGFWRLLLLTLALTAMRRSQLVGLKWADIDVSDHPAILLDIPPHEKPLFRRMGSHYSGSYEASFLNSDSESWEAS